MDALKMELSPTLRAPRGQRGIGLIEVLIALLILAFGFLALASLQGAATRSAADARARAAATFLAQEKLEELRTFAALEADADGDGELDLIADTDGDGIADAPAPAFDQIAGGGDTPYEVDNGTRGFSFTRNWSATPCEMNMLGAVACGGALGAADADFMRVVVRVAWTSVDRPEQTFEVVLEDSISNSSPLDSAVALNSTTMARESPRVYIQPARLQNTIPIAIGDDRNTAASDPQPNIIRDNVVRTQFDVLTFQREGDDLLAKRNFDYTVLGCQCRQEGVVAGKKSLEPSYWNGLTFTRPREVENGREGAARRTGAAITRNSDSEIIKQLCTACCRDHHDSTGSQSPRVNPFRPNGDYLSALGGDHPHFLPVLSGQTYTFTPANAVGEEYYETCRFIRRDGIYRLTLDARLENLVAARATDFDQQSEVEGYSEFARRFVDGYVNAALNISGDYAQNPPDRNAIYNAAKTGLPAATLGMLDPAAAYPLPSTGMQLISRGIFIDYMTPEVIAAVRCKVRGDNTSPECLPYAERTKLELVPFFAVGMTRLNNWRPQDANVATVPLRDRQDPFSRGYAVPVRNGTTNIIASSPITNIALTNPIPATALEQGSALEDSVPVNVNRNEPPPPPPRTISFSIGADSQQRTGLASAGDVLLSSPNGSAVCTNTGSQAGRFNWTCVLNTNGIAQIRFDRFIGSEQSCTGNGNNRVCTQVPKINRLCISPALSSLTMFPQSNRLLDYAIGTTDGNQASSQAYTVNVKRSTDNC